MNESGTLATIGELFAPPRRRYRVVTLPISGLKVRIQSLWEHEVAEYQSEAVKKSGSGLIPARIRDSGPRLIVRCVVDGEGNRIMGPEHVAKLAAWDAADANYLHRECMNHCGIREDEIEGLEKNSDATPADASPTE